MSSHSRKIKRRKRMSESHENQNENHPAPPRNPSPESIINMLNSRLNQKAQEIRNLEDGDVYKSALLNDMANENAALTAAIDQVTAENRTLRERLGIDPLGPIEPVDEESVKAD
jgi:hypothetical protein